MCVHGQPTYSRVLRKILKSMQEKACSIPASLKTEVQFGEFLSIFMLQNSKYFSVGTNEDVSSFLSGTDDLFTCNTSRKQWSTFCFTHY